MCCQSQSLLVLVIFLFIALACIEIAVCAVSLYTNSHARTFLNHLWEISSHDFRLYIEVRPVAIGFNRRLPLVIRMSGSAAVFLTSPTAPQPPVVRLSASLSSSMPALKPFECYIKVHYQ